VLRTWLIARKSYVEMSAQKYTALQICIICFLAFLLGTKALLRHSDWFDSEQRNDPGLDQITNLAARPFITLGSATSIEDSGFLDFVLPIFQAETGLEVHVAAVGTDRL
jgi:hypothetical protein